MKYRFLFACLALNITICGCGGDIGPALVKVTGTVTFEGKPLAGATVTMISEKGDLSNGFTDSEGRFTMTTAGRPGVPVGKVKVGITKFASNATNVDMTNLKGEDMMKMQLAGGGKAKDFSPKSEIPEKYGNPDKSVLVANVEADASKNVFEFPLVAQ